MNLGQKVQKAISLNEAKLKTIFTNFTDISIVSMQFVLRKKPGLFKKIRQQDCGNSKRDHRKGEKKQGKKQ